MSTPTASAPFGARRRLSAFFYRHRWLKLLGLLIPPLGWLIVVYLAALVVLLATAFWQQDELSGQIIHTFTWDNVRTVKDDPTLHAVTRQTVQMAVLVTITDILLAFPLAYYMARVASRRRPRAAVRGRADAAVVELPDQGLHVAADDRRRRHHQLGAGQDRPGASAHRVQHHRHVAGLHLHLAALHGAAHLRGAGADPGTRCSRPPATWAAARGARCEA